MGDDAREQTISGLSLRASVEVSFEREYALMSPFGYHGCASH